MRSNRRPLKQALFHSRKEEILEGPSRRGGSFWAPKRRESEGSLGRRCRYYCSRMVGPDTLALPRHDTFNNPDLPLPYTRHGLSVHLAKQAQERFSRRLPSEAMVQSFPLPSARREADHRAEDYVFPNIADRLFFQHACLSFPNRSLSPNVVCSER